MNWKQLSPGNRPGWNSLTDCWSAENFILARYSDHWSLYRTGPGHLFISSSHDDPDDLKAVFAWANRDAAAYNRAPMAGSKLWFEEEGRRSRPAKTYALKPRHDFTPTKTKQDVIGQ
jgi:hypothetical protein